MTLNEYQKKAAETAIYPKDVAMEYLILGLTSEAGEVAGVHKKYFRDGGSLDVTANMIQEMGDCMWYIAMLADELGVSLQTIAEYNIKKLSSRKERGVIGGSGDKR